MNPSREANVTTRRRRILVQQIRLRRLPAKASNRILLAHRIPNYIQPPRNAITVAVIRISQCCQNVLWHRFQKPKPDHLRCNTWRYHHVRRQRPISKIVDRIGRFAQTIAFAISKLTFILLVNNGGSPLRRHIFDATLIQLVAITGYWLWSPMRTHTRNADTKQHRVHRPLTCFRWLPAPIFGMTARTRHTIEQWP